MIETSQILSCCWGESWWHLLKTHSCKKKRKRKKCYTPGKQWTPHMMYSHIWSWHPSWNTKAVKSTRQLSVDITLWWATQIIHDPAAVSAVNGRLPVVPPKPGSHPYTRATLLTLTPVLYALHTLEHSQELIPLFSRVRHPHHVQVAKSCSEPELSHLM